MLSQSGSIDPQDGDRSFSETWFVGRHALYARHSRELPAAGSSRHRQKIAAIPASASILISAITLATHDMARAVRFYRMLGFEVIYGGDDAAFTSFRAGTSYLNLIAQRPSECGPGGDASRGMKRRMRPSIALRPGPAAEWRSRIGANPSCRANHLATGRSCGTRLDRLARSTRDLLNVIAALTERGAGFKSLKDTWADTTSPHGRLMLTVLGGLAEFERELIRARTGEGRKRAKDRGVKFGRPAALTPRQRQKALQRLANGNAQVDIARAFNVSQATISRLASL